MEDSIDQKSLKATPERKATKGCNCSYCRKRGEREEISPTLTAMKDVCDIYDKIIDKNNSPKTIQLTEKPWEDNKPTTKEINRLIIDKCDCIKMLLVSKNTSYAAALFNPINQFSSLSAKETCNVLIDNKLSRLKNGKQYKNENDILDLVGYLINLLVIIDIETPSESPND